MKWMSARDGSYAPVPTATPDTTVFDVVTALSEDSASAVIVVEDDDIKGTFYDRDYVMKLSHGSLPAYNVKLMDVMSSSVVSALPDTTLTSAVWALRQSYFLPVMRSSKADGHVEELRLAEEAAAEQSAAAETQADDDAKDETAAAPDADVGLKRLPLGSLSTMLTPAHVLSFIVSQTRKDDDNNSEEEPPQTADSNDDDDTSAPGPVTVAYDERMGTSMADLILKTRSRSDDKPVILNTQIDDAVCAADAANEMANHDKSCVLVVDARGQLQGLFTAMDFLSRVVLPERDALKVLVTDVMSDPVMMMDPQATVLECAAAMVKANVRHMPVVDPNSNICVGIVTQAEVLQALFPSRKEPGFWRLRRFFRLLGRGS